MTHESNNTLFGVTDETINKRREILNALEKHNDGIDSIAKDRRDVRLYLEVLAGMDTAILGRSRAETDEKMADNDAQVAQITAELAKQMGSQNIFKKNSEGVTRTEQPKLPDSVKSKIEVPHHVTETGRSTETIEEFNKRMDI